MGRMSWRLVVLGVLVLAIDTTLASCPPSPQDVMIPNTVTTISLDAYYDCPNITGLSFQANSNLETIGSNAFYNTIHLTNDVNIPSSVMEIGNSAFESTAITSLSFEENSDLETIGERAFYMAINLTGSLIIPSSVTEIGSLAFELTAITSLSFETNSDLETIGQRAFDEATNLTGDVNIPSLVTAIGDSAFRGTAITSVTIPESVTSIGTSVFNRCRELARVIVSGDNDLSSYTSSSNLAKTLCERNFITGFHQLSAVPVCIEGNGARARNIIENPDNTCGLTPCNNTARLISNNDDDDDDDEELSTGALVGIIVGGVVLLLGLAWGLRRQLKQNSRSKVAHATTTTRVGKLFF